MLKFIPCVKANEIYKLWLFVKYYPQKKYILTQISLCYKYTELYIRRLAHIKPSSSPGHKKKQRIFIQISNFDGVYDKIGLKHCPLIHK